MKPYSLLIILLATAFSQCLFGQHPFERSKLICEDTTYLERRGGWSTGLDEGCKSDFYRNDFTQIPEKHFSVIEKIEETIIARGGEAFYKKLTLASINIAKVKNKSCNDIAYVFRYLFSVDDAFNYRFALFFDEDGNQIGDQAFPDFKTSPNFLNFIPPCPLIDSAKADKEFDDFYSPGTDKMINYISMEYDIENNRLVFVVMGKEVYGGAKSEGDTSWTGWFYGRKVYFDSITGEKIKTDRFKTWKSVRLL